MAKFKYKGNCPCGDFEFVIVYESPSDEEQEELFCPFCSVALETDDEEYEDLDE